MAPATTQEEGGDASRARWWRMQRGDRIRCAPSTTPEEAEEASRSPSVAESRVPRGGGLIRHAPNPTHEEGEEALRSQSPVDEPSSRQDKKKKRKSDGKKSKKRKRARDIEHAHFSEASSATSSPLRWPLDPPSQVFDPAIEDACVKLRSKFHKKSALHRKLITLARPSTRSCIRDEKFLHVRDSVTPVVMKAGKAVLRLSSYIDDKPLSQSSGFLIDWNKDSKPNTILTSALLIRSNSPSDEWSGTEEYIPDAVVLVHLLDKHETTIAAHLLHYDKHFNIALFKIDTDVSAEIPSFSTELVYGQEAFVLGRDDGLFLNIDHGRIQYQGPNMYECRHYVFMSCHLISQCGAGGPVIDFNGQVLGMAYPGTKFIPSSIILRCLQMWKKFSCVPRLHLGMKFSAIKFLDPAHVEKISIKYNIDTGLIVKEVSGGSVAEKLGVRTGDIIESLNGESIASTIELENMLMSICEDCFDNGEGIGSIVNITVNFFFSKKLMYSTYAKNPVAQKG